ncbi:trypsin-like serine peptidase [Thalassobaculum sp.]|jgi:protease YdgD|uniref:trypsin-like serine peptidase n=1 Tax=Thalassobaculum sp. TaxID=2022740 RepID=UPI003B5CFE59
MTVRLLLLLAALLAAGLTATGPSAARDGRVTVAPDAHPWASIGRLNVAGYRIRRHCTGTLVAPDLVLTANHCLNPIGEGKWADPSNVHFLAGYARGEFKAHRTASGYIPLGPDSALVRLSAPIDLPAIPIYDGPLPASGAALAQAGYSGDRGHVLTVDPACSFLGTRAGGQWRHNCEAVSGDSGSPLLIDRPGGLSIAAIHVGRIDGTGDAEPVSAAQIAAAR